MFKRKPTSFKPVRGRVTVVTVTYNADTYLEATILSILSQNYPDVEFIIIDGGSTDKTLDIIKKYQSQISYWVSEPDNGIYDAMNKGIVKAKGEWINFMNVGDGFMDENSISNVMSAIPVGTELVYGNTQLVNEKGKKAHTIIGKDVHTFLWKGIGFNHNSLFCKTVLVKKHPFNTFYKIVADSEFIIWCFKQGKQFYHYNKVVNYFLLGGLSQEQSALRLIERWKLVSDEKMRSQEEINKHYFKRILHETNLLDEVNINK